MSTMSLQAEAVRQLVQRLPEQAGGFDGSQFPLPVTSAIMGGARLDLAALRRELESRSRAM